MRYFSIVKGWLNHTAAEAKTFICSATLITDQLRVSTVSDEIRYSLLGWTEGSAKRNTEYNYGDGFPLQELKRVVDTVQVGFDLSHLYLSKPKAVRKRRRMG